MANIHLVTHVTWISELGNNLCVGFILETTQLGPNPVR